MLRCREAKFENRSTFRPVLTADLSMVVLDDTISDAQSEAHAFPDSLGRIERIENTLRVPDAGAGIGKLHHHLVTFLDHADRKGPSAHLFQSVSRVPDNFHAALKS